MANSISMERIVEQYPKIEAMIVPVIPSTEVIASPQNLRYFSPCFSVIIAYAEDGTQRNAPGALSQKRSRKHAGTGSGS